VGGMTVAQLKQIWEPDSKVTKWSDVNPEWPMENINLYGPGTNSGTFDYFTEVICGETGASRADYQQSEDDNVLVTGVSGDRYALGYFGYAYYVSNKEQVKALGIAP
jgi:phosphate transport system substrate-binding protein